MNAASAGQALVVVITLAVVCVVAAKAIARKWGRTAQEFADAATFVSEWNDNGHRSRLSIVPTRTNYIDDVEDDQAFMLDHPLSISQYIAKTEAAERNASK